MPAATDLRADRDALMDLRVAQHDALLAGDADTMGEILASSFEAVHITGASQDRGDWLNAIRSGRMQYHAIDQISVELRVDGDLAVATDRAHVTATIYGSRATWPLQSTTTYSRIDERWFVIRSVADLF